MNVLKKLHDFLKTNKMNDEMENPDSEIVLPKREVLDITYFIDDLEEDRELKSCEIEKCNNKIKSLIFDLDVMENLYQNCFEEMMKQEKTINYLRQAYFDHHEAEFNLKLDNFMLSSILKERNKYLENYQGICGELNSIKEDLKYLKNSSNSLILESELESISSQLKNLQNILLLQSEKVPEKVHLKWTQNKSKHLNTVSKNNKIKLLKKKKETETLKSNLRHQKAIIKYSKLKSRELKECLFIKEHYNQQLLQENGAFKEKITFLENELCSARKNLSNSNDMLSKYQEKCKNLIMQLEAANNAYHDIENQFRVEQDSVEWLEYELNESTSKGAEICFESKQIVMNIKKWMYLVKKERRNLLLRIKDLQNVNKMLAMKQRVHQTNHDFGILHIVK